MGMDVRVYTNPMSQKTEIAIFNRIGNSEYQICRPFKLEFKPYNDLDEIEPTLIMDNQFSKDFLLEFSRALNQAGYSDNSTDAFANELKATKYHLEDMRTLVLRKEERTI